MQRFSRKAKLAIMVSLLVAGLLAPMAADYFQVVDTSLAKVHYSWPGLAALLAAVLLVLWLVQRLADKGKQQRQLAEQKDFAVALLENAGAPIFVLDAEHRVIVWNQACAELTGVPASAVMGTDQHWRGFYAEQRPCLADLVLDERLDDLSTLYAIQKRSHLVRDSIMAEGWVTMPGGHARYLIFSASPVRNGRGEIIAAIETMEDITARREAEGQLEYLAHFDPLTSLPNRLLFFEHLQRGVAEAERYGLGLGLFFLDLDGFKAVNDTLGHDAGDRVLVEVAERLKQCVRACDTVARMGGDEFTIILSRVGSEAAAQPVLERIEQAFAAPFVLYGQSFPVGASIGSSFYPVDGREIDILVKKADSAMYLAKDQGRQRSAASPSQGGAGAHQE